MESNIALTATVYLFARIAVLLAFAFLVYRILQPAPKPQRIDTLSHYARERFEATRSQLR